MLQDKHAHVESEDLSGLGDSQVGTFCRDSRTLPAFHPMLPLLTCHCCSGLISWILHETPPASLQCQQMAWPLSYSAVCRTVCMHGSSGTTHRASQCVECRQVCFIFLVEPGFFRSIHDTVHQIAGGQERLEVLALAATSDEGPSDFDNPALSSLNAVSATAAGLHHSSNGLQAPVASSNGCAFRKSPCCCKLLLMIEVAFSVPVVIPI